jgi:hypothetical protein
MVVYLVRLILPFRVNSARIHANLFERIGSQFEKVLQTGMNELVRNSQPFKRIM